MNTSTSTQYARNIIKSLTAKLGNAVQSSALAKYEYFSLRTETAAEALTRTREYITNANGNLGKSYGTR